MYQNPLSFFNSVRSDRQDLEDWAPVFNRLLPWISPLPDTLKGNTIRYFLSGFSVDEFRLLVKTGIRLHLSPFASPKREPMAPYKTNIINYMNTLQTTGAKIHQSSSGSPKFHCWGTNQNFYQHTQSSFPLLPHLIILIAYLKLHGGTSA